jgi:peptidoglycan hydrolase-like protein with peptidoglycan-binding domain
VDEGINLVPGTVARRGDRGPVVIELQSLLAQRGFSPGGIDGIFGTRTEQATAAFQASVGLTATGVVDDDTFDALSTSGSPVPSDPAAADPTPDPAPSNPVLSGLLIKPGDRGPEVIELQTLLQAAGYSPGGIDGVFGSLTSRAVRSFQSSQGLVVDGIVGPVTLDALGGDSQRTIIARRGDIGGTVVEVQTALADAGFSPGLIDGYFGQRTDAAVRAAQTSLGLRIDGLVDTALMNALG